MASSKKSSFKAHVLSWKLTRTFLLLVACETRQNLGSKQATASNASYISRNDSTILWFSRTWVARIRVFRVIIATSVVAAAIAWVARLWRVTTTGSRAGAGRKEVTGAACLALSRLRVATP